MTTDTFVANHFLRARKPYTLAFSVLLDICTSIGKFIPFWGLCTWFHLSRYQFPNIFPENELLIPLLFLSFYVLFDLHTLLVGMINSVDVCQSNRNLLAAGGWDQNIKIFDKREAKIVQIFEIPCESTMFYKFNSIIFNAWWWVF